MAEKEDGVYKELQGYCLICGEYHYKADHSFCESKLRDKFAMAALTGYITANLHMDYEKAAVEAYDFASAMLAEKKKRDDKDNGGGR